jgi:hypothetical protein
MPLGGSLSPWSSAVTVANVAGDLDATSVGPPNCVLAGEAPNQRQDLVREAAVGSPLGVPGRLPLALTQLPVQRS